MSDISNTLLRQRLRNRIIDTLEAFADINEAASLGTGEVINMWFDFVDDERMSFYVPPVFSTKEIDKIRHFHALIKNIHNNIDSMWEAREITNSVEWSILSSEASSALATFGMRGKFDEENEIA